MRQKWRFSPACYVSLTPTHIRSDFIYKDSKDMRDFLKKYRFILVHTGIFSFFITLLNLTAPLYGMQVFDRVMTSRSSETLLLLTLAAIVAMGLLTMLEMLRSALLVRLAVAFDNEFSETVLHEMLSKANNASEINYRNGLRDLNTLRSFISNPAICAFFDAPLSPLFLIVLFMFHPLLGTVATLGMLTLIGLAIADEYFTLRPLTEAASALSRANRFVDMSLRNSEVVTAMGMTANITRRWDAQNKKILRTQTVLGSRSGVILAWTRSVRTLLQMLSMGTGVYLIIAEEASPGIMLAATFLVGKTMAPVEMAIGSWQLLAQARSAYKRLAQLLDNYKPHGHFELPPPQGALSVEQIVFGFSQTQVILKGVSFQLLPGESLAVIGPSAAGKSTLVRVILGIWPAASGVVRIDGANISDWNPSHLGRYIGYLPQDVELFSGTVAENICRMGDAETCAHDIVAAAQLACAHEIILRLPNGYDTDIGDQGISLSGGQRQRIALARALFGTPKLVLLDEPNSNLDAEGEQALIQAILNMKQRGITVIVVTHRVSALAYMDMMLVLNSGKIEMFGPRQEVLNRLNERAAPSQGS